MTKDDMAEFIKTSAAITAAADAAKRREQEAPLERIAALEEKDASLQVIIPALIERVLALERLLHEQKHPQAGVPKPAKKSRTDHSPSSQPEQS